MTAPRTSEKSKGLLRVLTNEDLERQKYNKEKAEAEQNKPLIIGLSAHIGKQWELAKTAKWQVERKLLKAQRQRKGKYNPEDLSAIREFGGSEVYMMISNVKMRAIESWVKDVLLPAGEKPWSVDPTPQPDLPEGLEKEIHRQVTSEMVEAAAAMGPQVLDVGIARERIEELRADARQAVRKEAQEVADLQEERIEDVLREGDFYTALSDFIRDFSTYHTAFLKGPIMRRKKRLVFENGEPVVRNVLVREYKRISPFDLYPSPSAKSLQDGFLFERIRIRPMELQEFRLTPGFSSNAIDMVLEEHKNGLLNMWLWTDAERAQLEDRPTELLDSTPLIDCLVYNGPVQGRDLLLWGMSRNEIANENLYYEVTAWKVKHNVIMARLNKHPLGRRDYYGSSFEKANDTIWGVSPAELLEDCQRICNAVARSAVNNMAIASGPQVEVHKDRVDGKDDIEDIYPWKIWRTQSDTAGRGRQAVYFWQPQPLTDMLMKVYEYFFKQAGEQIGVPAYEHGSPNVGGAGKTAHGLAMLMTSSSKIMKNAIMNIDSDVITKLVYDLWVHLMLYEDDFPKHGDINVVARASEYLIVAEQLQMRRMEFLQFTNNPLDNAIIGPERRAKVLREVVKTLKMSAEDIVPDEQEMKDAMQRMAMAQMGASPAEAGQSPSGEGGTGGPEIPETPTGPGGPGGVGVNPLAGNEAVGPVPGPGPEPSQVMKVR